MTQLVNPKYGGVVYSVARCGPASWALAKRQGDRVFAEYAVHLKSWHGNSWLECDVDLHPTAVYNGGPTLCKHVEIVQAHIDAGAEESVVRWIKGGR